MGHSTLRAALTVVALMQVGVTSGTCQDNTPEHRESAALRTLTQAPQQVRDEGHYRHAHWLATRDGQVRWATAARTAVVGTSAHADAVAFDTSVVEVRGAGGVLESRLEVPFPLLGESTWRERPTWRVLEMKGATWVICLDRRRTQLHVYDLASGAEVISAYPARELFDTRLVAAGCEVLVAVEGGLELLELHPGADPALFVMPLVTGLESLGAAAFALPVPGSAAAVQPAPAVEEVDAVEVWAAGWSGANLSLVRVANDLEKTAHGLGKGTESAVVLTTSTPLGSALRLGAVRDVNRTWLALADPDFRDGRGRLFLADARDGVVEVKHAGRFGLDLPEVIHTQRGWGQSVVFVPDVDQDGVPDLVVAGPGNVLNVHLDLVSCGRRRCLTSYSPGFFQSTGHGLDVSLDGRLVLVGGAEGRGMPEAFRAVGMLTMHGTNDLCVRSTVRLGPTMRERWSAPPGESRLDESP